MPWPKKSKPKAERVVRAKQRDGTIKEYRYPAYKPEPLTRRTDTLAALVDAYKDSPEWRDMAPATRTTYSIYLRPLEKSGHVAPQSVRRRDILSLRDAVASASGNAAANYFVTASRQLWKWAIDREWVEDNPAVRIGKLETGHLKSLDASRGQYRPGQTSRATASGRARGALHRPSGREHDLCSLGLVGL